MSKRPLKNRDYNWLFFNERVLLEAANPATPILERLKFLAIFSSNLDEYFKVRVSQLRQLKSVDKSLRKKLISKPNKTLKQILQKVDEQQNRFGEVVQDTLKNLKDEGVHLKKREELDLKEKEYLANWFTKIASDCTVIESKTPENLKDGKIYLIAQFSDIEFEIIYVPSNLHPRFIEIPGNAHSYVFLEDVIKLNLNRLFPNQKIIGCFAIKLSRDAELYLEDDYTNTDLVDIIYESLGKRKSGQPTRLLYDQNMPDTLKNELKEKFDLDDVDLLPGGEYHNYSDFFSFPNPFEDDRLSYEKKPPLPHPFLSKTEDIFETILTKDQLVHFPYQEFEVVERFLHSASIDPKVTSIKMSLYRIAKTSVLSDAILLALKNNKEVVLFVEAQARFDEENNIKWGRIFEEQGAKVYFSVPQIKVHSKILMVERRFDHQIQRFTYIGTGNFNSKTAKIYCDHGLFTAHKKITSDLAQVFGVLEKKLIAPKLKHLLVSPFTTRPTLLELIENEIENATAGIEAKITLKMNSLEDSKMIKALYKASEAGVEIRLLVRGFCCLLPKEESLEENERPIYITSIVDRYLEHGRIYLFENGGEEKMYIGSADWMTRNLDRRIEVLTPILDDDVFRELKDILLIQLSDNVKARVLDSDDTNQKVEKQQGEEDIRSQYAIYEFLKAKLNEDS
ncbi:polyphosphate kinase 1 [Flagellimonas meridianipacifica]|uniref:Polyphosphate kinase n=1 Tax=Flagellimonas meridianipacifica TaxID=1080225 RepID=A0A2T0MBC0_9FLAO|nr:polyphosphate kinase 1 [Allomuricauda pacifica]PRX54804.1 polyphosphate kinase [Allomuricauda pacifica]